MNHQFLISIIIKQVISQYILTYCFASTLLSVNIILQTSLKCMHPKTITYPCLTHLVLIFLFQEKYSAFAKPFFSRSKNVTSDFIKKYTFPELLLVCWHKDLETQVFSAYLFHWYMNFLSKSSFSNNFSMKDMANNLRCDSSF